MAGTPEGHVEVISTDDATLVGNLDDGSKGGDSGPTSCRGGAAKSPKVGDQ